MKWFSRLQDMRHTIKNSSEKGSPKEIMGTALSMILIFINGALGVIHLFALREAVTRFTQDNFVVWAWRLSAVDFVAGIILVICWLVMVFVLQYLYEKDFRRSWIPKRFLIVLAIQVVLYYATVWYAFR